MREYLVTKSAFYLISLLEIIIHIKSGKWSGDESGMGKENTTESVAKLKIINSRFVCLRLHSRANHAVQTLLKWFTFTA